MNSMNYIGKFISNFRDFYNEINTATLTGAIDVVVIEQPDGTFNCSPFHVRFGKLGVLRSREKVVDMEVNGEPLDIHMKLGESGEAFFVEELSPADLADEEIPPHLACSPIPSETFLSRHPLLEETSGIPHNTFRPETVVGKVSEKVRRISLVSGEFRPIESERLEAEMGVAKPTLELHDSWNNCEKLEARCEDKWAEKPVEGARPNAGAMGKRKRRKKSLIKKKGSKKGGVREAQDQQVSENIFVIDDLEPSSQPAQVDLVPSSTACVVIPPAPQTQMAENNFHFFSDTELTPESSPVACPSSPAQSDTELERVRHSMTAPADEGQSWRWGELPSPPPRSMQDEQPSSQDLAGVSSDVQRSMLSGMFSFMKKTKRLRRGEGMYLADIKLEELDPEVAALYFPSSYHQQQSVLTQGDDDDAESGNGTSLPHSPQSVEGTKHSEAELELMKHSIFDDNAAMSLCGGLEGPGPSNEAFLHGLVTYEDLCSNPKLLESSELVVRLGSKYYSWGMACSVVMSALLYQRPLPQTALEHVCESPKDAKGGYASWFSWRRPVEAKPADSPGDKMKPLESEDEHLTLLLESNGVHVPPNGLTFTSQSNFNGMSDAIPMLPDLHRSHSCDGSPNGMYERVHRKTLRLTSEQIASLNLKEGANEVMFSVTTAYQGTTRCKCHIYKWRYDDRIVISDIDGTITKSDVLGHILPIVGKDWAQSGVAQLFTKIKNNGYKLLYLSARAIGQARVTREYLRSIKQGDLSLPDGPLLLNPTSLVSAFHREVIERKPEEFKISCLRDIQALFPADTKPFYAGYGNKVNDVWAYRAVGIPIFRIFTINHRGELKHELTQTFQSSYSNMSFIVDQMFPPSPAVEASEDYSSFVYWRDPIADVPIIDMHTPIKKQLVPQPTQ